MTPTRSENFAIDGPFFDAERLVPVHDKHKAQGAVDGRRLMKIRRLRPLRPRGHADILEAGLARSRSGVGVAAAASRSGLMASFSSCVASSVAVGAHQSVPEIVVTILEQVGQQHAPGCR